MRKKLLTYILPLAALGACSDDVMEPAMREVPEDGRLTVQFAVPEMETVRTRVDDQSVATAMMLVFDNGSLAQASEVTPEDDLSCTITLKSTLRKKTGLQFVFIVNSKLPESSFPEGTTLESLKGEDFYSTTITETHTVGTESTELMLMSGTIELSQLLSYSSVPLVRNAAQVTLSLDGEAVPYQLYGNAASSPAVAGAFNLTGTADNASYPQSIPDLDASATVTPLYLHPTANASSGKVHVIAKLPYSDNKSYYYRLEIADNEKVYDLEPNHHYQLVVKGVNCKGYATPTEAAKHPFRAGADDGGVTYYIHDHAPAIYNMISDGVRELGVPHTLTRTESAAGTQTFYVKVLDKSVTDDSKLTPLTTDNFRVTSGSSWVKITGVTAVSNPSAEIGGDGGAYGDGSYDEDSPVQNPDASDAGKIYAVTATFTKPMDAGDLKGSMTVTWNGLTREIPVVWERIFRADEMLNPVKLTIASTSDNYVNISDVTYFDVYNADGAITTHGFIPDEDNKAGHEQVKGVKAAANNGNPRNEGLHFPMPYGTGTTYTYKIPYKDLGGDNKYSWKASISDNMKNLVEFVDASGNVLTDAPSGTIEATAIDGPTIYLRNKSTRDYTYAIGEVTITVTPDRTDQEIPYPLTIYHTGFFHQDVMEDYVPGGTISRESHYTYYEVVELVEGHYWLDRNLGAHSAGLYIEMEGGTAYHGDESAGGYCYRVGKYVTDTGSNTYKDPEIDSKLCPPGYGIPVDTEWGLVRKSSRFHTEDVGSYFTTHFVTSGPHGNVYFPKIGYRATSDSDWQGESRAGYYWTSTPSSGLEKAEIGNWLRAFTIVGNATSYINAEVYGKVGSKGYAMPIRCVAKSDETATSMTTDFFVKGATHVYLYNAAGAAVTEWPGVAICTHNTASKDWFNFYYQSTAFDPNGLYVIFNFKDEKGRIHTFSKGPDGTGARITTTISPATIQPDGSVQLNLQGWKVVEGDCDNGEKTALGDKWECILNPTGDNTCVRHNEHNLIPHEPIEGPELPTPSWDAPEKDLWLIGTMTNWGQKNASYKLTQNRNIYTITVNSLTAGWKINNGSWSETEYNYGAGSANQIFTPKVYHTLTLNSSNNIGAITYKATIYVILIETSEGSKTIDHTKTQIFIMPQ